MNQDVRKVDVTVDISESTTISTIATVPNNATLIGFYCDAAWDTQAVTFTGSRDGGTTYGDIYSETTGTQYSVAGVVKQRHYGVDLMVFLGYDHLKIVSGVAQGDDTVVSLFFIKL
jgi:hypothetical protein